MGLDSTLAHGGRSDHGAAGDDGLAESRSGESLALGRRGWVSKGGTVRFDRRRVGSHRSPECEHDCNCEVEVIVDGMRLKPLLRRRLPFFGRKNQASISGRNLSTF